MFGQKFPVFSVKTLIAIGAVLVAMILWSAIPQDPQLSGFQVFSEYLSHTGEHFQLAFDRRGSGRWCGSGALLYSLSSLLFARTGTVPVIFALLALAALLMIKTEIYMSLWQSFTGALQRQKKPKPKRYPKRETESNSLEAAAEEQKVIGTVELGKKKKEIDFLTPARRTGSGRLPAPVAKKKRKKRK